MNKDSSYDISIVREECVEAIDEDSVRAAVETTLARHGAVRATIGLAIVSDAAISELHKEHLGIDGPTDVLTFDLRDRTDDEWLECEIVISQDTAQREAQARGHNLRGELALYAVHGLLHLLGYDDRNPKEAARMHREEDEILTAIGLGPVYHSTDHPRLRRRIGRGKGAADEARRR